MRPTSPLRFSLPFRTKNSAESFSRATSNFPCTRDGSRSVFNSRVPPCAPSTSPAILVTGASLLTSGCAFRSLFSDRCVFYIDGVAVPPIARSPDCFLVTEAFFFRFEHPVSGTLTFLRPPRCARTKAFPRSLDIFTSRHVCFRGPNLLRFSWVLGAVVIGSLLFSFLGDPQVFFNPTFCRSASKMYRNPSRRSAGNSGVRGNFLPDSDTDVISSFVLLSPLRYLPIL